MACGLWQMIGHDSQFAPQELSLEERMAAVTRYLESRYAPSLEEASERAAGRG